MWEALSAAWQAAFEEAWTAYRNGSIPIGAAITRPDGTLLVRDRNRAAEPDTVNRLTAHAEANALRRLDTAACDVRTAVLYTTMEPCPMCLGTAVMSNIRHLRYAARDPWCGCAGRRMSDPYLRDRTQDYVHEGGCMEFVQLVMQSCHELRIAKGPEVLQSFAALVPDAVRTAEAFHREKRLELLSARGAAAFAVYDEILRARPEKGEANDD